jgi:DedD protein
MASASTDAAEIRRRGRQRLIGAIAIVLLLVVFIPMLLDSEPRKPANEPPLDIPSKDNAPALPPPVAASSAANPAAEAPPSSPVAPPKAAAQTPEDRTPASAGVTTAPAAKAGTPPKLDPGLRREGTAAAPRLEGFAVQVGAFRDEAMLEHARDKLAAAGVPHYTERLDSAAGGPLTRLRAGPFPTRQLADGAAARLKAAQLPAQVVPLP